MSSLPQTFIDLFFPRAHQASSRSSSPQTNKDDIPAPRKFRVVWWTEMVVFFFCLPTVHTENPSRLEPDAGIYLVE